MSSSSPVGERLTFPAKVFGCRGGLNRDADPFWGHRCPFWVAWIKNGGPWFRRGLFHFPGPSIFPTGHLCLGLVFFLVRQPWSPRGLLEGLPPTAPDWSEAPLLGLGFARVPLSVFLFFSSCFSFFPEQRVLFRKVNVRSADLASWLGGLEGGKGFLLPSISSTGSCPNQAIKSCMRGQGSKAGRRQDQSQNQTQIVGDPDIGAHIRPLGAYGVLGRPLLYNINFSEWSPEPQLWPIRFPGNLPMWQLYRVCQMVTHSRLGESAAGLAVWSVRGAIAHDVFSCPKRRS